ncbi:MAG: copper chaperone PCu(A)C [Rhodobacteraceae bacterium]|nr:copper chaperone PCu(A)C [Paracoccaceae bacterium]
MTLLKPALAALAFAMAAPAFAADTITVSDAYARILPGAKAGAIFMVIDNSATADDRLTDATSDAAKRVELHTHKADASGVMQMLHVPEGFVIPAGGQHQLARGGDHVMLMGPTMGFKDGDTLNLTLSFENAGEVTVLVPVDNAREGAMPSN